MKKIVILGAGTAGTMMANHLARSRGGVPELEITVIDRDDIHLYQPGLLFLPFGIYQEPDIVKSKSEFLPKTVRFVKAEIEKIEPAARVVKTSQGGDFEYDVLILATGCRLVHSEFQGLQGKDWLESRFDFYTLEGSRALGQKLRSWDGGRLVVHIKEMPIKCPVAPLEFTFLADAYFRERGIRDRVKITYVTPLPGAFTKPVASKCLGGMLAAKDIELVCDYDVERIDDSGGSKMVSFDGREIEFDLLVTTPTNMGDSVIEASGLGDELGYVPTHPKTLQSKKHPEVFVIGDATNVPASKAGSVAHFEAETLVKNVLHFLQGRALEESFDGHTNCFIETGHGKGLLIDFSYDQEPLPGEFPFAKWGPLKLLQESRMNHWGKMAFRWVYWNMLLKARPLPFVQTQFSLKGKLKGDKHAQ